MIKPVGHRVMVEVKEFEETSAGGIVLPTDIVKQEQAGMEIGKIVALGPSAYLDFSGEPWVKVGDMVHFKKYEGVLVESEGKHFRILNDEDVFAVDVAVKSVKSKKVVKK